jgi:glutathione S-transferase
MVLTIHHLGVSQSERILWLCEELGLEYKMVKHVRAPAMAPESLKKLPGNELGKAPFVEDSDTGVKLSESGAIVEYILGRYGQNSGLAAKPTDDPKFFADYLYWLHWANATLQAEMVGAMFLSNADVAQDNQMKQFCDQRMSSILNQLDRRLKSNKCVAGEQFTAADIMIVYCVTTQRYFGPQIDLSEYQGILRWLSDVGKRQGYQRAMEKGDPEMQPLLGAKTPEKSILAVGGVESDIWKKSKM